MSARKTTTKKSKVEKVQEAPGPSPPRIYTWNNGGRMQALHESGTVVAVAPPPTLLDIPQSFITIDGMAVLTKDCDIEPILPEDVGTHKGLDKALGAIRKYQEAERRAEPKGPTIIQGEIPTGALGSPK